MPVVGEDGQSPIPEPPPGSGASADQWYAVIGGARQGPLTLAEMHSRVASDSITGETLVWNQGMPNWRPAQNIPELFPGADSSPPPPLPPKSGAGLKDLFVKLDGVFSDASTFRWIGRACALIAVVICLFSLLLAFFGYCWFSGALLFALAFFIGEATGAVLEAVKQVSHAERNRSCPAAGNRAE